MTLGDARLGGTSSASGATPLPFAQTADGGNAVVGHSQRTALGLGLVAAAGVCFGVQNVLAKVAYDQGVTIPTVLFVRFAVAALAVTALARLSGARRPPARAISGCHRLGIAALGLLFVGNSLFAYLALARLPAGATTLLVFAFPALVILWSRLFFREPVTPRAVAALCLALAGCLLTLGPSLLAVGPRLDPVGVAWAGASALSNSWYATLAPRLGRGSSGLRVAAGSLPVTAGCFAIGWLVVAGSDHGMTAIGWLVCLAIGLLAAASVTGFLVGAALVGGGRAAIAATSEPVAAVLLGGLVLGEAPGIGIILGGVCIIGAIILLARSSSVALDRATTGTR